MALIRCPECGKEVSDQAQQCIHCGYPLDQAQAERYALVLIDASFDYPKTLQQIQEQLRIDDYTQAKALADQAPTVLKRGLTYDACVSLAGPFRPYCKVKMVRDSGGEDALLTEQEPVPLPEPREEKQGLGFGGTVLAVILGVVAALLILSVF